MRKVVAVELVSLDGVMESPEEWAPPYSNDEMEGANAAGMAHSDALLLGRVIYEALAAFWPSQPGGTPMVDYVNSVPKAQEVAGDKGIGLMGANVDQQFLAAGFVDEIRIHLVNVLLGGGRCLLEMLGSQQGSVSDELE